MTVTTQPITHLSGVQTLDYRHPTRHIAICSINYRCDHIKSRQAIRQRKRDPCYSHTVSVCSTGSTRQAGSTSSTPLISCLARTSASTSTKCHPANGGRTFPQTPATRHTTGFNLTWSIIRALIEYNSTNILKSVYTHSDTLHVCTKHVATFWEVKYEGWIHEDNKVRFLKYLTDDTQLDHAHA
jgi:hypothetical protein